MLRLKVFQWNTTPKAATDPAVKTYLHWEQEIVLPTVLPITTLNACTDKYKTN